MKKYVLLIGFLFVVSCKTKMVTSKSEVKKNEKEYVSLDLSNINVLKNQRAYELGKRVLMTCNTSKFKTFTSNEATDEVINNINQDKISLTCQNILRKFGQFKDMKLIEAYYYKKTGITVFRFKCDYEKKYDIKELQVSVNDENKVSAISSKNWKNEY